MIYDKFNFIDWNKLIFTWVEGAITNQFFYVLSL